VSPAQPLMVSVGEAALLPCHLSPRMNAEDMEVRWFRSSFPEVIHLYQDGQDQPEQQIREYQGRTELLRDNITEGSVVLRIHHIGPADEGQYSCFFQSSTFYGAALTSLWAVALAVVLSVLGFLISPAIYYCWMQHREKGKVIVGDSLGETVSAEKNAANRAILYLSLMNPNLFLDRKRVRHGDTRQDLPDNPGRFEPYVIVLGAEGFTGGRRYWEVEVGKKPEWTLGVCRESVRRKGSIIVTSENGYFVVCLRDGEKYWARTSPLTPLPVSVRPSRVGIFLDYEAGEVSFYNVTDRSHLFTFTDTFSETLRPYFSPCLNEGGKNADPLIIHARKMVEQKKPTHSSPATKVVKQNNAMLYPPRGPHRCNAGWRWQCWLAQGMKLLPLTGQCFSGGALSNSA
uniref:Uncharacterized protein n=1 Tax=Chelydra serpentina TaxID=8475 RepID=A0A8C3S2F3_CHESE